MRSQHGNEICLTATIGPVSLQPVPFGPYDRHVQVLTCCMRTTKRDHRSSTRGNLRPMMLRPCLDTLSARVRLETPSQIQSVLFRMKDSRSCAYGGAQVPPASSVYDLKVSQPFRHLPSKSLALSSQGSGAFHTTSTIMTSSCA